MDYNNVYARRRAALVAQRHEMQEGSVNFKTIITDILNHGVSKTDLSVMLGVSNSMVAKYKHPVSPSNPNYEVGARLIDIHRKIMQCGADRYCIDSVVQKLRGF